MAIRATRDRHPPRQGLLPAYPLTADRARRGARGRDRPARRPGRTTTTRSSITSNWCRTPRSRCPDRRARRAIPRRSRPPTRGRRRDLADLVERLGGAVVATHSQSGIMGHHMARILKERGHLELLKGLITIEGSCSLPNSGLKAGGLRQHPVSGAEGRLHRHERSVPDTTVDAINARRAAGHGTAKAEYIKLDELGIRSSTARRT